MWRGNPKLDDIMDKQGKLLQPADKEEVEAWEDRDAHALAIIIETTTDSMIPHIQMADTSMEARATLKDLYETSFTICI